MFVLFFIYYYLFVFSTIFRIVYYHTILFFSDYVCSAERQPVVSGAVERLAVPPEAVYIYIYIYIHKQTHILYYNII